jgi:hypothetical protein
MLQSISLAATHYGAQVAASHHVGSALGGILHNGLIAAPPPMSAAPTLSSTGPCRIADLSANVSWDWDSIQRVVADANVFGSQTSCADGAIIAESRGLLHDGEAAATGQLAALPDLCSIPFDQIYSMDFGTHAAVDYPDTGPYPVIDQGMAGQQFSLPSDILLADQFDGFDGFDGSDRFDMSFGIDWLVGGLDPTAYYQFSNGDEAWEV